MTTKGIESAAHNFSSEAEATVTNQKFSNDAYPPPPSQTGDTKSAPTAPTPNVETPTAKKEPPENPVIIVSPGEKQPTKPNSSNLAGEETQGSISVRSGEKPSSEGKAGEAVRLNDQPLEKVKATAQEIDAAAKAFADAIKAQGGISPALGAILGRGFEAVYDSDGPAGVQQLIDKVNGNLGGQFKLDMTEDPNVTKLANDIAKQQGLPPSEYVRLITVRDAQGVSHGRMVFAVPKRGENI